METFVVMFWLTQLCLVLGVATFVYYLRSRKRWAWNVSVLLLVLAGLGLSLWVS